MEDRSRTRARARPRPRSRSRPRFSWVSYASVVLTLTTLSAAPELVVLPREVFLNYPGAEHRILIALTENGALRRDLTPEATYRSSDSSVVEVAGKGLLRARGDGQATVTAEFEGRRASLTVRVENATGSRVWSFRNDVQPVLTKRGCNSGACHGAAAGKRGFKLSLRGFDEFADHATLTRRAVGRRVNRIEPDQSLILLKPLGELSHGGDMRFEDGSESHAILKGWIEAGAAAPREDDPRLLKVEIFPGEAVLKPGARLGVLVCAHYSDGSHRDVTPWVKFGSTADAVAAVDDEGVVKVLRSGEAAITAWFSSKITYARISVPYEDAVPEEHFARARLERRNFIDDHVLRKLEALRIAPSPSAGDLEFLRRVYLDTIGVLPTRREALRFAADSSPDKRRRLIDKLLERTEFVDYWTYKWSDLLLLNSRKIPGGSLTAFYNFIRKSVEENKPWDQFAREIVTARGSTLQNGAAGYYLMHKDPIDLTETTSLAFLGMSITCARCHNHPLEKWTQDEYYGMANLFARVKLKNGDRGGEALVLTADFGEVIHPRRGVAMPPKPLDAEAIAPNATVDRREYLAWWLTSPENPYFSRAIVNRVWKNFLGRGLVDPEDDVRLTNPASNEPLFHAVVADFVAHGFDIRHLVRTILNSATYQRSSRPVAGNDGDGVYYSHYIIRRLPAEVILDTYSQVTEVPTDFPGYPKGFRALQLRNSQVASYFLKTFGRPERVNTCSCERSEDSSLTQVLHLSNGETLDAKLRAKEGAVTDLLEEKLTDEEVIDELYLRALTHYPGDRERTAALEILKEVRDKVDRRVLLEDLFWSVLSSKQFLFNS